VEEIELNGKKYVLKSSIKTKQQKPKSKNGLEYCIVRTYSAGVFAGWVDRKINKKERTIFDARRLWKWKAKKGIDCASIAEHGVDESGCKFSEIRPEVDLTEVIEVQPCTKVSMDSILAIKSEKND